MSVVLAQGAKPILGYEKITVDATVGGVALTSTAYNLYDTTDNSMGRRTAKQAMLTVETASIRVSFMPGIAPIDSTTGHLFAAGDVLWLESSSQIKNFRAVRVGGASATVHISYFGE